MNFSFRRLVLIQLSIIILLLACRKKDAPLPDNEVQFETTEQGIAEATASTNVKVRLTRAADRDIPVTLNVVPTDLVYGTDYTTTPSSETGAMQLTILSGSNEASFTVSKKTGVVLEGNEILAFKITSSGSPVIIGGTSEFVLKFAEIVATQSAFTVNGGGPTYPNKVFIDLSANKQTPVQRTKWDLGFYTHPDSFRVILNSSSAMMAKMIDKNDLNSVNANDTLGFSNELFFNQTAPTTSALRYIDYPDGDLSKTAIASVKADATENKVYIINRGNGIGAAGARGWKKIRILRNGSGGYTLQHADIAATTFQEVQVAKDDANFFKYISFETGAADVEPAKKKWDIAWSYFSNVTNFGGGEVPYLFQDIILQNRNVQVAKVLVSTKAYADFAEADLAGLTLSGIQTAIGSDWRSGGGPSTAPAVRTDRYYIIKDGDNNYYKLKFTALTQNGERGYPALEYALVKRGG